MSSYELLELVEQMDERGRFKTAARGGDLCTQDEMLRHLTNEMAKLRSTMHAVHGGKGYSPKVFMSVSEQKEMLEEAIETEDRREGFYSFADRDPEVVNTDGHPHRHLHSAS